jgi:hypothetical protein
MHPDLARLSTSTPQAGAAGTRAVGLVVAAGIAIAVASYAVGNGYFVFIVIVPLVSGFLLGSLGRSRRLGAAAWTLGGLTVLVMDWVQNDEDQLFHLVVTMIMVGLFVLGHAAGGAVRSHRHPPSRWAVVQGRPHDLSRPPT